MQYCSCNPQHPSMMLYFNHQICRFWLRHVSSLFMLAFMPGTIGRQRQIPPPPRPPLSKFWFIHYSFSAYLTLSMPLNFKRAPARTRVFAQCIAKISSSSRTGFCFFRTFLSLAGKNEYPLPRYQKKTANNILLAWQRKVSPLLSRICSDLLTKVVPSMSFTVPSLEWQRPSLQTIYPSHATYKLFLTL